MSGDVQRHFAYARENVTFFVEEMIVFILRRRGVNLEIIRSEHRQYLRAVAMFNFSPCVGDAIITTFDFNRDLVLEDCELIWSYIRDLRRHARWDVLHASLVVYGMRLIRQDSGPRNLFILMAVVTELCERFCRFGHTSLVGSAVSSLEYILTHLVHGGFVRTLIRLNNHALQMRISPNSRT